ncbi:MAG: hypothetical protein WA047_10475 [Phenylobacterium sp.]|uniref:hypothetical protein n=1 Tax=Phenylobacterium sp. TaxID=1871053 RepID=UPI003BB5E100
MAWTETTVTASVLSHETEACRTAGMDEVVAKPVDTGTLLDAISRQMSTSAATRVPRRALAQPANFPSHLEVLGVETSVRAISPIPG